MSRTALGRSAEPAVSPSPTRLEPTRPVAAQPHGLALTTDRATIAVVALVTLAGAALRLWRAETPLWLDEIWSLDNLAGLAHGWDVFWRISHDNNHFLNSLWLFWVAGESHAPLLLRAPAILTGVALISLTAKIAWRRETPETAAIAALLIAFSYFFVAYSAEARGYAGEALALAAAFFFMERGMAAPASPARLGLAAAAGLGLFWHLGLLPALAALALACLLEQRRREGRWDIARAGAVRLFAPAALATLPALACLGAGILLTGKMTIGGLRPFAYGPTFIAMAAAIREAIGAPEAAPDIAVILCVAAAVALGLGFRLVRDDRRIAYAIFLLGAPFAVLALRPANAHITRYYLACLWFLILFAAEALGALWRSAGWRRAAAVLALVAILAGDSAALLARQAAEPAWPEALATIEASGAVTVAASAEERVGRYLGEFNRSQAQPLVLATRAERCAKRPDWLIAEAASVHGEQAEVEIGPCRLRFAFVGAYDSGGPEAAAWRLYRRSPDGSAP
jgi:hypothetical protein